MTDEQRARDIAHKMAGHFIGPGMMAEDESCPECRSIILTALRQVRAEERERCAAIASSRGCAGIAAAIHVVPEESSPMTARER